MAAGNDHADGNGQDVNLSGLFTSRSAITINEADRLRFARQILLWPALICTGVFIAHGTQPENQAIAQIFELIKIGAFPLVIQVISFYFPRRATK